MRKEIENMMFNTNKGLPADMFEKMVIERDRWRNLANLLLGNYEDAYGITNAIDYLIDSGYTREELIEYIGYDAEMVDEAFADFE